mgnify:CR=1 FL=1
MLLESFWRFTFLLFQTNHMEIPKWTLYSQAFFVGLRLDAIIASVLLIPVVLTIFWIHYLVGQKIISAVLKWYLVIVTILISYLSVIDIFFFEEFNTHLNILLMQSNVVRIESILFLWQEYPIIKFSASILVVAWTGHLLLKALDKRLRETISTWPTLLGAGVLSLLMLVTGLRGGWQERPIDWGYAMFSEDNLANQIALNGIFFLGRSVIELSSEKNLRNRLHFSSNESALENTKKLIGGANEIFLEDFSLKRKLIINKSIKPNIVLIILESHVGLFCGYINPDEQRVTPVLDSLASQGIAFTHSFANGPRSAFGISSILMSWPVLPGLPLISLIGATKKVPCIANYLKEVGYNNIFLYGGDSQFDNMQGFAKTNGYDRVIDRDDLPALPGTMWGIYDHHVFDYAKNLLDEATAPLQLTLFTTTNHQPWEYPETYKSRIPDFSDVSFRNGDVHRTMAYVDLVIGEFMASARKAPWFDNTIFVFVADHGLTVYRDQFEDLRNGHIPMLIYAPGILAESRTIERPTSQVDILPTLFGIIGYAEPFEAMGRDVLNDDGAFASRITNDYMLWLEDDYLYTEILGQSSTLSRIDDYYKMSTSQIQDNDPKFYSVPPKYHDYLQTAFTQFKSFGR